MTTEVTQLLLQQLLPLLHASLCEVGKQLNQVNVCCDLAYKLTILLLFNLGRLNISHTNI